jgi:hypothetical protein
MDNKALTIFEFKEIMTRITWNHRFAMGGRGIKYVRPHFDMRDCTCYVIKFDNMDMKFDCWNEGRMYDNIIKWLEEKESN